MALLTAGIGICLALAAAPQTPPRYVSADVFTLAWTHSIEKVRWEEDYEVPVVGAGKGEPRLQARAARVRGSAAGMEPPPDAILRDGWYEYQPTEDLPETLRLTRSGYTADYELCMKGQCRPMSDIMPSDGDITLLYACRDPAAR